MNRGLLVATVAVGLLALSVSVGVRSLAAPPGTGGPGLQPVKMPDLMVKWVSFAEEGAGEFELCTLKACIRNTGTTASPAAKLAVYQLQDAAGPNPALVYAYADVPPIAVGDESVVTVQKPIGGGFSKTLFLVLVDCPVAGKQLGQVSERRFGATGTTRPVAEVNNSLLCPLDPAAGLPKTIYNPGACAGGF